MGPSGSPAVLTGTSSAGRLATPATSVIAISPTLLCTKKSCMMEGEIGGGFMPNNRLRGAWDQMTGIGRELWGEMTGDEVEFSAGQRQRKIGKLEAAYDMSHEEAELQVDRQKQ